MPRPRLPRIPTPAIIGDVWAHWSRERRSIRQGLIALIISTVVGLFAGLILGFMEDLLATFAGLLMLVPAAIGMRGAIFGALGARLGTGILTGQFDGSIRSGSFAQQNIAAAALLTLSSSAIAALSARLVAGLFGIQTISVWELMIVSMVGGILASAFVLVGVVALARTALARSWDMDAIGSPVITTTGDLVTLPALVLATYLLQNRTVSTVVGILLLGAAIAAVVTGIRTSAPITRQVCRQMLVVLTYAAFVDVLAGGVLETRVESLLQNQALLVLIPPFIANCGSLGGILSARLGTELHLGLLSPRRLPERLAALDGSLVVLFAVVAFGGVGLIAHSASVVAGFSSPGLLPMVGISLLGGAMSFLLLFLVAYYAAITTYRFGLDPDNYGIPIVTATMDFMGVLCLVAAIFIFGVS